MTALDFIRGQVGERELYAQLAEEATELAHAALKMRRTLSNENPTPVQKDDAHKALLEECADVVLCMRALNLWTLTTWLQVKLIMRRKLFRWIRRLRGERQ